jgi:hypothetical protein
VRAAAPAASPARSAPSAPTTIDTDDFNEAFVRALKVDFATYGATAIAAMRGEKPVEYVKTVAALCTKETSAATDPLRQMSDGELARHIAELAGRAGYDIRPLALPRGDGQDG